MRIQTMQDLSKLSRGQGGRGWILWPERGFVGRDNHLGLELLDRADPAVKDSLRFKEKFRAAARERFSASIRKVNS